MLMENKKVGSLFLHPLHKFEFHEGILAEIVKGITPGRDKSLGELLLYGKLLVLPYSEAIEVIAMAVEKLNVVGIVNLTMGQNHLSQVTAQQLINIRSHIAGRHHTGRVEFALDNLWGALLELVIKMARVLLIYA
ncbi:hypothetical protein SDC9_119992 [bioreactor metagenome]|uniref:Uncharacterized protein n=1 Tax=bioreactor metagenome TaxID=1076179 RepID=A0A645C5D9_9ZZZZ